jgi:hypothetical protein
VPLLNFPIQQQCGKDWCWITVAVCTDHYYDPTSPWLQGTLANALIPNLTADCSVTPCTQPLPGNCDTAGQINHSLGYVQRLRTSVSTPILFGDIKLEIDAADPVGHPVCAGIQWMDMSIGHAVVICGYDDSDGSEWITVADPGDGQTRNLPFLSFLKNYEGKGTWTNTYYTQK